MTFETVQSLQIELARAREYVAQLKAEIERLQKEVSK